MKQTVNEYAFIESFRRMGRMSTPGNSGNFTYSALQALFGYLEEYEDSTGEELELDPIAICCDYAEYNSALEAATEYGFEPDADEDADEQEQSAIDWLNDNTTVIEFDGGVVIQSF